MEHKEFYTNGYGVSIISNEYSYGGRDGLFEVAILKGDEEYLIECFVIYFRNNVEDLIEEVKKLPPTLEVLSKNRDIKIDDICG